MNAAEGSRQNVTVRLDRQTLRRAKILAAKRNTSISRLLAEQIEHLVGADDAYEQAHRQALDLLDRASILAGGFVLHATTGMSGKSFVDTNVLIYAHDVDAGKKHEIAKDVLRTLWAERDGILSVQVLQEFYVNVTRKISEPLTKTKARTVVETYAVWCVDPDTSDLNAAFRIEDDAKIGFRDALIIAVAARSGAARVLSEELNAGQLIAGLAIENPFSR